MSNKRPRTWIRLDNAAKLFASTVSKRDTKVFRFACELNLPIDPSALQEALNKTLAAFPMYRSVLKRGFFWYFFEESDDLPAIAQPETLYPCSALYDRDVRTLLFRVSFYKCRINLEVFHVLTDGTGALEFLRLLVYHYLTIKHEFSPLPQIAYDASMAQRMDDSFSKYYRKLPKKKGSHERAMKLRGTMLPEYRIGILEGVMPTDQVLALAKRFHTTVTILFTAIFMLSIARESAIRDRRRPVKIVVPVNLRRFFPSNSARNFFGTICVPYRFGDALPSLEELIPDVKKSFDEQLFQENVERRMNGYGAVERNAFARATPLILKDWALRAANWMGQREETAALSNVGRVEMPEEFKPYIKLFDVFVSTNAMQICMCSYENNMTVSFTSPFVSTDIQKNFFRELSFSGIPVTVNSNMVDRG